MPWVAQWPVLVWAILTILFTFLLWRREAANWLNAFLALINFTLFQVACFLVINWVSVDYWLRVICLFLPLITVLGLLRSMKDTGFIRGRIPFWPKENRAGRVWLGVHLALLVVGVGLNVLIGRSMSYAGYEGQPVLLLFPVRTGMYVITNGGNGQVGSFVNNHLSNWPAAEQHGDARMAYAVDAIEMRINGVLGPGVIGYPEKYFDFEGFRDFVYTPCPGEIVYIEDGHPDVHPSGQGTPLGNYVVVHCANTEVYVTLANLKNDSIDVTVGEQVYFSRMLGMVGSSGVPPLTHLHVHATSGGWKEGEGQPVLMLFDGIFSFTFPVRNAIYIPQ